MPKGSPLQPKPNFDISNPRHIRAVIEMPICRATLFVKTELERDADAYVDGSELWAAYRLWAHRTPMSESSFLAALEKANYDIYADADEWLLQGWKWPHTKFVTSEKRQDAGRPSDREYTFTKETILRKRLKELAMRCKTMNGIAEGLGWPERKFAMYRTSFPAVERMIEKVWRENPDRFKKDEPMPKGEHIELQKKMAHIALQSAIARRNLKQKAG